MRLRLPFVLVAVAAAFAAGLGSSYWVRDAHAQAAPFAASVYVPSDGLAFRTFDGRVVARLSYDPHGGVFEVYDEHEQPAARIRGDALGHGAAAARPSQGSPVEGAHAPAASGSDLGF